jgi:uncharacterized protein (DUF2164 family)
MAITLAPETSNKLRASIQRYFRDELEQEIGDLKAGLFLDYCLKEVGACVYNQAISDARSYFADRVGDLEGACYEREFTYWKR